MTLSSFDAFLLNSSGKVFRFLTYRRMFTPYEQSKKYMDESFFEEGSSYEFATIEEAISLNDGDYLLGLKTVDPDTGEKYHMEYRKLSEIQLAYFEDEKKFAEEPE